MPSKSLPGAKAKGAEAPPSATNFRQIKGINQLAEARLHRAGITTFEELANLQPEEMLTALGNLKGFTVKQIIAQDWIGQALKLAGQKPLANGALGSEGFIVDIFLSQKKHVHSTQILHVSSAEGEQWQGWDSDRLLDFIVMRSGLVRPPAEAVMAESLAPEITAPPATLAPPEEPAAPPPPMPIATPPEPSPALLIGAFEMIPSHSQRPSKLLRKGESFDLRLSLEAQQNILFQEGTFDYSATIFAKDLEASHPISLGVVRGVLAAADEAIVMSMPRQNLPAGTYRLEAALIVCKGAKPIGSPAQMRTIFQVF